MIMLNDCRHNLLLTIVCDDDKIILIMLIPLPPALYLIIFMWKQMTEKLNNEFSNYVVFDGISFLLLERSNERWQMNKWQMKIP